MSKVDDFLAKLASAEKPVEKPVVSTETTVEKTAEEKEAEALMFKLANQNETIEASTVLGLAAGELFKLAEESKDELIGECAEGLSLASQSLMFGLNKIAAEDAAGAITDMVETQDSLQKIATVLAAVATEAENEDFTKLASSVIEVSNTLFDELKDLAEKDESVAGYLAEFHKEVAK
jgi:hypothetical protein